MTHADDLHRLPLQETVTAAHDRTRTALASPDDRVMDAVVWLSAHLAAMEHAVYPFMRASLPADRKRIDEQRRLARRIQRLLRLLEQRCAGDGLAPPGSAERIRGALTVLMAEHEEAEGLLLARLSDTMTGEAGLTLAERYDHAIGHGPTRPHPHGPHHGKLGRLTYAFDAARDHLLDVLDSRHVPLPRPDRLQRQIGRWGRYVLGSGEASDQPGTQTEAQGTDQSTPRRQP
jgi:hypothetical protein